MAKPSTVLIKLVSTANTVWILGDQLTLDHAALRGLDRRAIRGHEADLLAALERGRQLEAPFGEEHRPADDDIIRAVPKRLSDIDRALLVICRAVVHRTDARRDHQHAPTQFGANARRLQSGRHDAVTAGCQRTASTRQHESLDIAGEPQIVEIAAIQARPAACSASPLTRSGRLPIRSARSVGVVTSTDRPNRSASASRSSTASRGLIGSSCSDRWRGTIARRLEVTASRTFAGRASTPPSSHERKARGPALSPSSNPRSST